MGILYSKPSVAGQAKQVKVRAGGACVVGKETC